MANFCKDEIELLKVFETKRLRVNYDLHFIEKLNVSLKLLRKINSITVENNESETI